MVAVLAPLAIVAAAVALLVAVVSVTPWRRIRAPHGHMTWYALHRLTSALVAVAVLVAVATGVVWAYPLALALHGVAVAAAAHLLLDHFVTLDAQSVLDGVLLAALGIYPLVLALWVPGTLFAALGPLVCVTVHLLATGLIMARLGRGPLRQTNPSRSLVRDVIFVFFLLVAAVAPLFDWLMCATDGAGLYAFFLALAILVATLDVAAYVV